MTTIHDVDATVVDFKALTPDDDAAALQSACGAGSTVDLIAQSSITIPQFDKLHSQLEAVYNATSCETMAPLMQQALYENSCSSLSKGLLWTFVSALGVATFGTIMLSLRSATLRPQIYIVAANPASRSDLDNDSSFG